MPAQLSQLEDVFKNVVSAALGLCAIVLFIMLILGGYKYITSGGDPKGIEGAKKTLTYAVGGLLLILLSLLILNLIENITGVTITEFKITQ